MVRLAALSPLATWARVAMVGTAVMAIAAGHALAQAPAQAPSQAPSQATSPPGPDAAKPDAPAIPATPSMAAGGAPGAAGANEVSAAPTAPAAPAAVATPVAQPVPPRPVPLPKPVSPALSGTPAAPAWTPAPSPQIGSAPYPGMPGGIAPAPGAQPAGQPHVVRPGETLDMVIARTVGQSPLRPQVVRDAIVQANPHAFIQGNPHRLVAGATIVIPTPGGLRDHAFPEMRAPAPPMTAQQALEAKAAAARSAPPRPRAGGDEDRRRWVRYP
jgi:hypothetical protein